MRRTGLRLLTAVLFAGFFGAATAAVSAGTLAEQVSSERGVTVRVTPRDVASTAKVWEFDVALETHSQDLTDDLKAAVTLIADDGAKHAPTAWDGDPAGGHHRKGVLRFAPLKPQPETIELRILRQGESSARTFRWRIK